MCADHRYHTRVQNIELECWIFRNRLPSAVKLRERDLDEDDAYYWRVMLDPRTLHRLDSAS